MSKLTRSAYIWRIDLKDLIYPADSLQLVTWIVNVDSYSNQALLVQFPALLHIFPVTGQYCWQVFSFFFHKEMFEQETIRKLFLNILLSLYLLRRIFFVKNINCQNAKCYSDKIQVCQFTRLSTTCLNKSFLIHKFIQCRSIYNWYV